MSRRVKCHATGEYGTSDSFIKVDGKYYKNQEVYEKYWKNKESRNKCLDDLLEVCGYGNGRPVNTIIFRRLKEWNDYYSWETIIRSVALSRSAIQKADSTKSFTSEAGRLSYMLAIINNNLADANKSEPVAVSTIKEAPEEIEIISAAPKKSSVANFLNEEEISWI